MPRCSSEATEVEELKSRVAELEAKLQQAEARQERTLEANIAFINDLATSSAAPTLCDNVDFGSKEMLAKGNFGFVFVCDRRGGHGRGGAADRVIVKVQRLTQADTVAMEWHHGTKFCKHPNVVVHSTVLLHSDKDGELRNFFEASYDSGALKGVRPRLYPDSYLCIIQEFMDSGDAQQLVEREAPDIEGVASITRQIADALAYVHHADCVHNDIKPANILLKEVGSGGGGRARLQAKLGDLGSMEYSSDRTKDYDFFAYTIWCMALCTPFKKCPRGQVEKDQATAKLREARWGDAPKALRAYLPNVVSSLWSGDTRMEQVRDAACLASCELVATSQLQYGPGDGARRARKESTWSPASGPESPVAKRAASSGPSKSARQAQVASTPMGRADTESGLARYFNGDRRQRSDVCDDRDGKRREKLREMLMQHAEAEVASPMRRGTPKDAWGAADSPQARPPSMQERQQSFFSTNSEAPNSPKEDCLSRQSTMSPTGHGASRTAPAPDRKSLQEMTKKAMAVQRVSRALQQAPALHHVSDPAASDDVAEQRAASVKVENLMRRFPGISPEAVQRELDEAGGHAGHAAIALQKLYKWVGG